MSRSSTIRLLQFLPLWVSLAIPSAGMSQRPAASDSATADTVVESEAVPTQASKASDAPDRPSRPRDVPGLSESQQARALEFAEAHHPELATLLNRLRKHGRAEYRAALRELLQDAERLERLRERMPDRYERELQAWKLDSRIQLLAARLTMSDDPQSAARLEQLVRQRIDLRIAQLKSDRERLQLRLRRLEEGLERLESEPSAAVEREVDRILHAVQRRQRPAARPTRAKPDGRAVPTSERTKSDTGPNPRRQPTKPSPPEGSAATRPSATATQIATESG